MGLLLCFRGVLGGVPAGPAPPPAAYGRPVAARALDIISWHMALETSQF